MILYILTQVVKIVPGCPEGIYILPADKLSEKQTERETIANFLLQTSLRNHKILKKLKIQHMPCPQFPFLQQCKIKASVVLSLRCVEKRNIPE